MLSIILNNWNNPDLQATQGYATSYTLRHGDKRLYRVHLSLQKGFYQMTEFLSPENDGTNFVLEQTNKSGRLKIAVFDKASGAMLGVLKGNTLYDQNEAEVFQLTPLAQAANFALYDLPEAYSDDLVALSSPGGTAVAFFGRLPSPSHSHSGLGRLRGWLRNRSKKPKSVMRVDVFEQSACDLRMLCAIAVVLHSRGGLPLK